MPGVGAVGRLAADPFKHEGYDIRQPQYIAMAGQAGLGNLRLQIPERPAVLDRSPRGDDLLIRPYWKHPFPSRRTPYAPETRGDSSDPPDLSWHSHLSSRGRSDKVGTGGGHGIGLRPGAIGKAKTMGTGPCLGAGCARDWIGGVRTALDAGCATRSQALRLAV